MARPIEYDYDEFINKTTELFLARGADHLSMADIIENTGLNRHSLYKMFPNKSELHKGVIKNYRDRFLCHGYKMLEESPQGIASIKTFFATLLAGDSPIRCLMVDSIVDYENVSPAIRKLAKTHYARIEKAYQVNIDIAKKNKEISENHKTEEIASFLVLIMQGLTINTKIFCNDQIKLIIFSYLNGLK
ncbi:MAG: TetR/AcrR family transcriptional regulator [Bdellovibrionota bacterium]